MNKDRFWKGSAGWILLLLVSSPTLSVESISPPRDFDPQEDLLDQSSIVSSKLHVGATTSHESYVSDHLLKLQSNSEGEKLFDSDNLRERTNEIIVNGYGNPVIVNLDDLPVGEIKPDGVTLINAPNSIIEDQIFNGSSLSLIDSPDSVIRNNQVINNENSGSLHAIYVENSPRTIISKNHISNFTSISGSVFGIFLSESDSSEISQNTVSHLKSQFNPVGIATRINYGIFSLLSDEVNIENNEIIDLTSITSYGIFTLQSRSNNLISNTIVDILASSELTNVLAAGIVSETNADAYVSANVISNIRAESDSQPSNSEGILLVDIVRLMIFNNEISQISSESIEPSVFGIALLKNNKSEVYDNTIDLLDSISSDPFTSFGSGMYFGDSNHTIIQRNLISRISTVGASVYGLYQDEGITNVINGNMISQISGISRLSSLSIGVNLRLNYQTKFTDNLISDVSAISLIGTDISGNQYESFVYGVHISQGGGISITNNEIKDITGRASGLNLLKSIGLGVDISPNAFVKGNLIHHVSVPYTTKGEGMGLAIWNSDGTILESNTITEINGFGLAYGVQSIGTDHLLVVKNEISRVIGNLTSYGVELDVQENSTMVSNNIRFTLIRGTDFALHLFFTKGMTILENHMFSDEVSDQAGGISIDFSEGIHITENTLNNKTPWLERDEGSSNIFCNGNNLDGVPIEDYPECDSLPKNSVIDSIVFTGALLGLSVIAFSIIALLIRRRMSTKVKS